MTILCRSLCAQVTRGDVSAVREALSNTGGLDRFFLEMYGADEMSGKLPISRRAEAFTPEDAQVSRPSLRTPCTRAATETM